MQLYLTPSVLPDAPMNPPHMIFHIINTAKYPLTSIILANNARIVHSLMTIPVLFARKTALFRFRTIIIPTRPMLAIKCFRRSKPLRKRASEVHPG